MLHSYTAVPMILDKDTYLCFLKIKQAFMVLNQDNHSRCGFVDLFAGNLTLKRQREKIHKVKCSNLQKTNFLNGTYA